MCAICNAFDGTKFEYYLKTVEIEVTPDHVMRIFTLWIWRCFCLWKELDFFSHRILNVFSFSLTAFFMLNCRDIFFFKFIYISFTLYSIAMFVFL